MADVNAILEERGSNYGAFSGHAAITVGVRNIVYNALGKNEKFLALPEAEQVVVLEAVSMIAHKLGRIGNGNPLFEDSWVDIAGYAQLVPRNTGGKSL